MSKQLEIKTSLEHRYDKSINILNQEVTFNSEGVATIEETLWQELKDIDTSLSLLDKSTSKSKEVSGESKKVVIVESVEEVVEQVTDEVVETAQEVNEVVEESTKIDLSTFSVKELKEMAKEANLSETEYSKLNKSDLTAYLEEKLK